MSDPNRLTTAAEHVLSHSWRHEMECGIFWTPRSTCSCGLLAAFMAQRVAGFAERAAALSTPPPSLEPLTPFHVFRNVEPDALCPTCGFPAWTHDPATAYLWSQRLAPSTDEAARAVQAKHDADGHREPCGLCAALEGAPE